MATEKELSDFLKSVEKRAWKRAVYAVRDDDAALDIVQDTMIRLAEKYVDRATDLGVTGVDGDGEPISLRELLVHMVEEYARHTGHADLLRERIDGRIGQ